MDIIPYKPMIPRFNQDYTSINGRLLQPSFQRLLTDIDNFYYEEYSHTEDELVLMGVPRHCLSWQFHWDSIVQPKNLLNWSFRSLPLTIRRKVECYQRAVFTLPSGTPIPTYQLSYSAMRGNNPEFYTAEPDILDQPADSPHDPEELSFLSSVSHDELSMSLDFLNDETDLDPLVLYNAYAVTQIMPKSASK